METTVLSTAPSGPVTTTPAVTAAPTVTVIPGKSGGFLGWIKRVFGFIAWVLTGFGLIGYFRRRQSSVTKAEEIVVYTVHRSFYLWSLILVGFVGSFSVKHWPVSDHAWGWIYIFVLLYTIASLLFDVSTMKALLWGGIVLLLWITSKYLEDVKHIPSLSWVTHHLANL